LKIPKSKDMPAFFIYLIKINVALIVFCLGYYLVLRHLTFYTLNRIYLIVAILFSSLYPAINISNFLNQHQQIARPVQVAVINWQQPVQAMANTHNYWYWLQIIFWLGAFALTIRLIIQLLSLYRLHKQSVRVKLQEYEVCTIDRDINPFSFWQNIYINPAKHAGHELKAILKHEHLHVKQWHTLDILLGELSTIFYWFNPGVWLIKKAIKENLEFITDQHILNQGIDSKSYQYSLLKVNFGAQNNAIVNHFNISTIKKRIIMMNAKKSAKVNITRYLLLVPAAMLLLLIFSVSKAELKHTMVKNGNVVLNALNTAAYNMGLNHSKTGTIHKKMLKDISTKKDTIPKKATKADTRKPLTLKVIRKNDEEPEFYINGKKVTEAEFKKLDQNKYVSSISVIKDHSGNAKVYIITKGHEGINKNIDTIVLNDAGTSSSDRKANTFFFKQDSANAVNINSKGSKTYTNSVTFTSKSRDTVVNGKPARVVAITTIGHPTNSVYNIKESQPKVVFKDQLILIDGKEATPKQLKKLPVENIVSITILKNSTAIEKYGDKGKNGVINLTTKKSN